MRVFWYKLIHRRGKSDDSTQELEYRSYIRKRLPRRKSQYERFTDAQLILRDQLAIDRTVLANERTFLAYCRTAFTLILTGTGCIKLFDALLAHISGWILICLGLIVVSIGVWRVTQIAQDIGRVGKQAEQSQIGDEPLLEQEDTTDAGDI
jgi:putative membrane protein